jgi:hypothetical protein
MPVEAEIDVTLTRKEFCALEKMSLSSYHKLQRLGIGPSEFCPPGTHLYRITARSRAEWHERMTSLRKKKAVELEKQRRKRSERFSELGKLAAQSPRHPCRRRQARKQRRQGRV